jgi:hypothetical protein
MKNLIKIIILLFACNLTFGQKLLYSKRGNIKDEKGNNLSSTEIRSILSSNETLLATYNEGRNKKTVGNILIAGGLVLSCGVPAIQMFNDKPVSTGFVVAGVFSMLIAIPVKIGFTKKIKHVVSEFNNQNAVGVNNFKVNNVDFIANANGLGLKLTLN